MELTTTDDAAAIAALYPALRRFAGVVGPVDADPDDLVQEAFARTLATTPLASIENPGAYLRRVIVNLASNRRRHVWRGRRALARLAASAGVDPVYPSDLAELLRLRTEDRAALFLAHVERLPYADVAAALGCTAEAARARAARARRQLRRLIEGDER